MSHHALFDDDGDFRAGTILASGDAALQVELPGGKRQKVKSSHVLLRFDAPAPARMLELARAEAEGIDLDFLWECAPQREFDFTEFAADYFGHAPRAEQAAALLLRLHGAPVYFHRKGRGRYRPAPAEILKAALAAVARKREQETLRQSYVDALVTGDLPAAISGQVMSLLINPDRNRLELKALEQAAASLQTTPLRLMLERGAIASPWHWHVESFLRQNFPRGTGFASEVPEPGRAADTLATLPLAEVRAFSIDDSSTTEIDDALSVTPLPDGGARVGVHIAAPALQILRDHPVDAVARARMSTVYAPALKYTMLPPAWIAAHSLDAGATVGAVSLYVDVTAAGDMVPDSARTRIERLRVTANLRHDVLDEQVTADWLEGAPALTPDEPAAGADHTLPVAENGALPFRRELGLLWQFARRLLAQREQARGRPEPLGRLDWSFAVDGPGPDAHVRLQARKRGAPLDLIVAEMMILANQTWGAWLATREVPAIYRSQSRVAGVSRVRMGTVPRRHEGIGVAAYAWSTSPLRRYVDLVNQRQIIAAALDQPAPYPPNDADLFAVVQGFESAYAAYAEFEQTLQRYWALRWVRQQGLQRVTGVVVKEDLVRLEELPWVARIAGLPELARGRRVVLDVRGDDPLTLRLDLALHEVLTDTAAALDETDEEELADAVNPQEEAVPPETAAQDAARQGAAPGIPTDTMASVPPPAADAMPIADPPDTP